MAGFRGMLAFWAGGAAIGDATEAAAAVAAEYGAIGRHGKGRKRRYFIELDGMRLYGQPAELERLLDQRYGKPPAPRRPASASPPQRTVAVPSRPVALAAPDFRPVDTSGVLIAKERLEQMRLEAQQRKAAVALLLLS